MEQIIKIKHSYNAGDLLIIMPGLRQLYRDTGNKIKIYQQINLPAFYYEGQLNSTIDIKGDSVCMNEYLFEMLKPLIEAQEYIYSFEIWEGQEVDLNYDLTRDSRSVPAPNGLLSVWSEAIFPETSTDLSEAWIKCHYGPTRKKYYEDKIIINRTQRYQNPYISYYFLKEYQDKIIFSGTDVEHEDFCTNFNLEIKKLYVFNFYELAEIISCCKFGIYNQSFNFHLADSLKTQRILELCPQFANTFCLGANGRQFYHQSALEFHFKKLLNK